MIETLLFKQLDDSAKNKAAEEVAELELDKKTDWSFESEMVSEALDEKLKELHLGDTNSITEWTTYPSIHLSLSISSLDEDYLKIILSEPELQLYNQLKELTDLEEEFFISKDTFYTLSLVSLRSFDEQIAMKLVVEHTEDPEIRARFAFLDLLDESADEDSMEELEEAILPIAEGLCENLQCIINEKLEGTYDSLVEIIKKSFDYFESSKCYFDELNEEDSYYAKKYKFTSTGTISAILND